MEEQVFSNNPRDYNRVTCLACNSVVKVHHHRRHLQNHGLTVAAYKEMYGSEYQYVLRNWHKCGICEAPMLFDLDTLYSHVNACHSIKIKEYVDLFLTPSVVAPTVGNKKVDADGAPILSPPKRPSGDPPGPLSKKTKTSAGLSITPLSKSFHRSKASIEDDESNCSNTRTEDRIQEQDEYGHLITNDCADYMLAECQICSLHTPMTRMRSHTRAAHGITIAEYKAQFGNIEPLELVYHRCALCNQLVHFDADAIALHLKSGNHPEISHKEYNNTYLVDTRPPRPYITEQEKADRAEQRSLMGSPCSPAHRSRPGSMRGSLVSSPAHRSGTNSPANRASINSPAHRAGTSSPGRRGSTSSPAHRSSTSSPSHRSATSSPTPSGTGSRGGKIYSTRGMGWRGGRGRGRGRGRGGKRGRGRGKRKKSDDEVDWKKKNMNGANKIRHNNHNDGRVPSRRRARMGQGAYDELEYDALLKMQFSTEEVYDEEDEWGELRQEESWGATLGEARRKLKEEMKEEEDDAWQSRVEEDEDAEQENFKEEATPTDQDSNSNSFSNLAIKSLQLGTKKLDVIILDGLEDAPDEAEEEYHASPFEVSKINSHNDQTSCNSSAAKSVEVDEADTEDPDDDNDSGQASCSSTSRNQWEHENNEKETTVEM